jgi:hypothetical protein
VRIEEPSILKAASLGLFRQSDDALNRDVWLHRDSKLHGGLLSAIGKYEAPRSGILA